MQHYFGPDPDALTSTAGITFAASPWLDVSGIGFIGALKGADHVAVLSSVSHRNSPHGEGWKHFTRAWRENERQLNSTSD